VRKKEQIKFEGKQMKIKLLYMSQLSDEQKERLMQRSMQDIASIYDYVRGIVQDVKERGDNSLLESLRDIEKEASESKLGLNEDEIKQAYKQVDKKLVD